MKINEILTAANTRGDCYEIAGRNMLDNQMPDLHLIHAYVAGQGPLTGQRYDHAWNEVGDVVFDSSNGRKIVMRKEQYYALGQVSTEPGQYARYNIKQALDKILKTKHWGPWDLK